MPKAINVVGHRFERLIVLRDGARKANGRLTVECLCDCGTLFSCEPRDLRRGHTRSCGCFHRDKVGEASSSRIIHGMKGSPEYLSWQHMKRRCLTPTNPKFSDYGGRGISICAEWHESFARFYSDMGPRPSDRHSLDRIDVNGDYEPANCRWADLKTQARNKRYHRLVEYNGETIPLSQACELTGIHYQSARYRLNRGQHWFRPLPTPPAQGGEG